MKIKFVLWGVVILSIFTLTLSAQSTTPAGNNILNPAYLEANLDNDTAGTSDPHPIESNTTYSFAMDVGYGDVLEIWLNGNRIMEENVLDPTNCVNVSSYMQCTFDSGMSNTFEFKVSGRNIARSYLMNDEVFMLQEGSTVNWYEPYEPVNDTEPVISAGGSLYLDYSQPINLRDLIGVEVTAYDEIDGDLTQDIVIVNNTYELNANEVGIYEVVYQVEDSAGNIGNLQLDVHVVDQIPPEISGPDSIKVLVDNPPLIDEIIDEHFTFWDDHDGDLVHYDIISNNYSINKKTVGVYDVSFSVEDSSGNQSIQTFVIDVVDETAPTIDGPNEITMLLSNPYTQLSDILTYYTVSDNYTASEDMSLEIINHDSPEFLDKTGNYSVSLEVRDSSGNITEKLITFSIVDDVAPELSGEPLVQLSYTETFDIDAYIASMMVSDNHDSLTTNDIYISESIYDPLINDVGRYYIVFGVKDEAGNTTTFSVNIETYDDIPPYFIMSDAIIVAPSVTLTQNDVFTHLMNDETVNEFNPTSMVIIKDDYTDNYNMPGSYEYHVELTNALGETMTQGTLITVNEIDEEINPAIILMSAIGVLVLATIGYILKRKN